MTENYKTPSPTSTCWVRGACSINTSRDACPGELGLDLQPGRSHRTRGSLAGTVSFAGAEWSRFYEQFQLSSPQRGQRVKTGPALLPPSESSPVCTFVGQGRARSGGGRLGRDSVDPLHLAQDAALVHGQDHLVVPDLLEHGSARELVARLFEVIP